MIISFAHCHKDMDQAHRLLQWIEFLSANNGSDMRSERLILVCNHIAVVTPERTKILDCAKRVFGEVIEIVRERGREKYPEVANLTFKTALLKAEELGQDMLFIEPDAVPMRADWFQALKGEWARAKLNGKLFMGGYVEHSQPHMTGNAVYGCGCHGHVPKLINVPETAAWDWYTGPDVLPLAHLTPMIQQIWRARKLTLEKVAPETVLFHQDKQGILIKLLDRKLFGGRLYAARNDITERMQMATKYYRTANASRRYSGNGVAVSFDPCTQIGGVWTGAYATDDPAQQTFLDALCLEVRGVREIEVDEYNALKKKQAVTKRYRDSRVLSVADPRKFGVAHVAKSDPVALAMGPAVETPESVLNLGPVTPIQSAPAIKRRGK